MSVYDTEIDNDTVNVNVNVNVNVIERRAQFDEFTINEIEHDRQLSVIHDFKANISKEAEFCGIYALSSYVILRAFMDSKNIFVKFTNRLTSDQLAIFKSVYFEIYNTYPDDLYLDKVALNISNQMYV